MIIEGKNVVFEALKSGQTFNKLFVAKTNRDEATQKVIDLAKSKGIRVDFVDKFLLDKKSQTNHHQGIIADVVEFEYSDIDDILKLADERGELPFMVLLDGIKDPHNLGAIIRSCECSGVHGIIIPKNRSVAVNETVIKTSAGAIANMKIARVVNLNYTIAELKQRGIWVYGFEAGEDIMYNCNLKGPIAVVIGSEGEGISELTKKKCDGIISIPLSGRVNSLNASVACGIAVFEIVRQRNFNDKQ